MLLFRFMIVNVDIHLWICTKKNIIKVFYFVLHITVLSILITLLFWWSIEIDLLQILKTSGLSGDSDPYSMNSQGNFPGNNHLGGGTQGNFSGNNHSGGGPQGTPQWGGDPNHGRQNNNSNYQLHFNSENDNQRALFVWMKEKLRRHRLSVAHSHPYSSRLNHNFTPQEHEYICDRVTYYCQTNDIPNKSYWLGQINGPYPDRIYTGSISRVFINTFFRT